MRRTFTGIVLLLAITLPLCAQHRGFRSSSGVRFSGGFRTSPRVGVSIGFRSFGNIGIRGGISFGHNPRFGVFANRSIYPRYYAYPYAYPYVYPAYPVAVYPAYPVAVYPAYPVVSSRSYGYIAAEEQPAYAEYPSDDRVGLAEQMRRQNVGVYRRYDYGDQVATNSPQPSATTAPPAQPAQTTAAPERALPATVLVYRDGRRGETTNYAVVGQTLWIFSEDRAQKVPLAQLDLEATRKVNEERGVEFMPQR